MTVESYVKEKYGDDAAKNLKRIRTGGDNNQKGATFEIFYAVSKTCSIAAHESALNDFIISAQEEAFVDDLCIRQISTSKKINYQAKNSSGAAANWNDALEKRFEWQREIDIEHHKFKSSHQVLLVSCAEKASNNSIRIPLSHIDYCSSEYFPYADNSVSTIRASSELRADLEKLCDSTDLSTIDSAFRLVLSAWMSKDTPRSIEDIIGTAKHDAKPDIFADFIEERPKIPGWLLEKCGAFQGMDVRVESGRFVVSYSGLDVSIGKSFPSPDKEVLDNLLTEGTFIAYLMSTIQSELSGT